MNSLRVQLAERSYDIVVTRDDLAGAGAFARQRCRGQTAFLIADEKVAAHAERVRQSLEGAGFCPRLALRPSGEGQKSLRVAAEIYDGLIDLPAQL